jgi:hypothetical protein
MRVILEIIILEKILEEKSLDANRYFVIYKFGILTK